MPDCEITQKLIKYANCPIAAPSANISGKPSGTNINDFIKDLQSAKNNTFTYEYLEEEDSFDFEGMMRANEDFMKLVGLTNEYCRENYRKYISYKSAF